MRFYRALLRLYPASFRAEYGEEMCAIFADRRRKASGAAARLALWSGVLRDVLPNALSVHMGILRQDVRQTLRTLRRSPGFTASALLLATLGIGATTATFSITDYVLLRPLPFFEADRLVKLWEEQSYRGISRMELSPGNFRDWKRLSGSFEAMAAYRTDSVNLVGDGQPLRLDGVAATHDLFRVLRAWAALGRLFTEADDRPGAPGTLVLSDGLWKRQFGGDPRVLGSTVVLNDAPHTVIGILPPGFVFPSRDVEFWTALRLAEPDFVDRTDTFLRVVARLKPRVSLAEARADMSHIAAGLERAYPKENARTGANVVLLRDEVTARGRLLLTTLFAAAVAVLLIACTNLANLLLARAVARRKELAVRTALGAGRERLLRQLLTESLLLASAGGVIGVLLAAAAVPLGTRLVPAALPVAGVPSLDLRVLAFAAFVTCATGVGFGLVPALKACSGADASGLREGSRAGVSRRAERLRSALVVAEVTASVVLLVGSGLLIRALWRLQRIDPGFRSEGVLTVRTALPMPRYEPTAPRIRLYDRVLSEVRALPGVTSAAYVSFLPMVMRGGVWPVTLRGEQEDPASAELASLRFVTPQFFATLRIPLRRGRDVAETDTKAAPSVAVVSESFARRAWPGEDPIGRRFRFAFHEPTVVGVVGDVRVRGLESESEPQVYLSYRQVDDGQTIWYAPKDLVIRSSIDPSTLVASLRRIVAKADPQIPVSDVRTLSSILDEETGARRLQLGVLGAFAAAALLLAAVGIHGLLAFTVSQRTPEIGVRIALGAERRDILRMILRKGIALAGAGVLLGVAIAFGAGRAMQALLVGVSPADAVTFGVAVGVAFAMTLAGSLFPALAAARLDPLAAIRSE